MSTNPFRRSSFKGPSGSSVGAESIPIASAPIDIPDTGSDTPISRNVDGKASTTQKHVNFASPPAIPISPISYPSSPESTRFSPEYGFTTILPGPTDYSQAIQSDPVRAEIGNDEDDGVLVEALQNAKVNNALANPAPEESRGDAVKNTLSRFASAPRKLPTSGRDSVPAKSPAPQRQTMDVDAFKRLLLTGDSGGGPQSEDRINASAQQGPNIMNDNGSGTDTASTSHRSLLDHGLLAEDSSQSSNEFDTVEVEFIRQSLVPTEKSEARKKPPPPTPRHGKPITEESISESYSDPASSQTSLASSTHKKAPTPPLTRRLSQNNNLRRPSPSRTPSSGDIGAATAAPENTVSNTSKVVPPPPRSRRPVSVMDRRPSSDLPTTLEESESVNPSGTPTRKVSDSRPPPPPSRNSSKRLSTGTANPPPLPPPRRNRGSSRSSIDDQRPQVDHLLTASHAASTTGQSIPSGLNTRRVTSGTHATGILADLAALQREVDEARQRGSI